MIKVFALFTIVYIAAQLFIGVCYWAQISGGFNNALDIMLGY